MKGWKLLGRNKIAEEELTEKESPASSTKVRITKALITLSDVLRNAANVTTANGANLQSARTFSSPAKILTGFCATL